MNDYDGKYEEMVHKEWSLNLKSVQNSSNVTQMFERDILSSSRYNCTKTHEEEEEVYSLTV